MPQVLMERSSSLISRAAGGNRKALSVLLAAARPVVFRWALAKTRDADEAEDITQRVLLRLHTSLSSFRGESRLSSWLYRVTAHEITGHQRKRASLDSMARRWREQAEHPDRTDPWNAPDAPGDRIDWKRFAKVVRDLARTLPPNQMAVFRLVDLDGLEPYEASRNLGKKLTTTRSTLCRARRKIRELFLESGTELASVLLPDHAALARSATEECQLDGSGNPGDGGPWSRPPDWRS